MVYLLFHGFAMLVSPKCQTNIRVEVAPWGGIVIFSPLQQREREERTFLICRLLYYTQAPHQTHRHSKFLSKGKSQLFTQLFFLFSCTPLFSHNTFFSLRRTPLLDFFILVNSFLLCYIWRKKCDDNKQK